MTRPEDRLRQLLQDEAEDIVPTGDGMRRIAARLEGRSSLRTRLLPAVAVAAAVAVAGVVGVTRSLGTDRDDLGPAKRPSASPTAVANPSPTPQTSPTTLSTAVTTSAPGTPVWPFTTDAQAAAWSAAPGARAWADDPVKVTQHLLDDYLKLPAATKPQVDQGSDATIVPVFAGGRRVCEVRLVRVGTEPNGPWSVTGASSVDLHVSTPAAGAVVSSPLHVTGTVTGYDQSVHLRLLTTAQLAEAFAPAGADLPWTQDLRWTSRRWRVAALVGNTFNGKGDLSAVTITAVRRTAAPG